MKNSSKSDWEHQHYDGLLIQAHAEAHVKAAELVKQYALPGTTILDVAAGEGALSKRILNIGFKPVCTSWNGTTKLTGVRVVTLDLDKPFTSDDLQAKFQCALAIEIIEHVENPACLLRSLRGVLQDGGYLILSTPNVESAIARLQTMIRGYPDAFSNDEVRANRHISILNRHNLDFLCEMAGFQIVERHFIASQARQSSYLRGVFKNILVQGLKYSLMRNAEDGACRMYVLQAIQPKVVNVEQFH